MLCFCCHNPSLFIASIFSQTFYSDQVHVAPRITSCKALDQLKGCIKCGLWLGPCIFCRGLICVPVPLSFSGSYPHVAFAAREIQQVQGRSFISRSSDATCFSPTFSVDGSLEKAKRCNERSLLHSPYWCSACGWLAFLCIMFLGMVLYHLLHARRFVNVTVALAEGLFAFMSNKWTVPISATGAWRTWVWTGSY